VFRDKFLIGVLLLTVIAGIATWLPTFAAEEAPSPVGGVLELSEWDPDRQGIIALDGQWEFYPNKLLEPGEASERSTPGSLIDVPGKWNGVQSADGERMRGYGFGTYRLLIRNAPMDRQLALSKNYVRFADKLYVDGVRMGASGQTGSSRDNYEPRNIPYTAYFQAKTAEIEILLQVSNFDYLYGGITNSLFFGDGRDMEMKKNVRAGLDLMGTIVMLLLSAFFVCLYFWFHKERLLILYSAFFFSYGVSVITNGERLLHQLFSGMSFELLFKIKSVSVYATPALLFLIFFILFRRSAASKWFAAAAIALGIYCAAIALLPFRVYAIALETMYGLFVVAEAGMLVFLLAAYVAGKYGALDKREFQLFFGAAWSYLLMGVIVALNNENLISMMMANVAFFLFVLFSIAMLAHQYFAAYTSMKNLARQLQMTNRMKDEFLLITSHELNTPLNGIINMSQLLLKEPLRKAAEPDAKEKLRHIRDTAYRISNMVKDIIDAAKIKDGKLEVESGAVDLFACVSVVIESFGFLAAGKNVMLVHQVDPDARYVLADGNRLMQVLYNAINYCLIQTQDGEVRIGSRRAADGITIDIRRYGAKAGASSEEAKAVGEGDNGFGIGLSIAHELIDLMGGQFTLDENKDGLEIWLPAAWNDGSEEAAASAENPEPPVSAAPAGRPVKDGAPRILIATADPVAMEHLYGMLSGEGFEPVCASTDKAAYALIARFDRPALALLDVMLPDSNGYELCRSIRKHFTQAELPVLFVIPRSTPADIEAGIAAGGSDFVARPLDAGEIRVRINTLLSMKRLVKEAAMNEMAFLRSQIKPHFLYNALGTIMSLCYTDGVRAGEMLGILSRYLRIIFHLDNTEETVMLSKEMELIQAYIDIEKERFGDRVRVLFNVDRQLYGCHVMPLTIEPLVENAIRHGISKKVNGGTVQLTIRKQGEHMQVVVEDDGIGMTPEQVEAIMERGKHEQGVGFRNIMRRVAHLTGKQPIVESERGAGTKITLWLPLLTRSGGNRE